VFAAQLCRLCAGHLECLQLLIELGARTSVICEGSTLLHVAVCLGSLVNKRQSALAALRLLLESGLSPALRSVPSNLPSPFQCARGSWKGVWLVAGNRTHNSLVAVSL
jgi:hypothetical protein